MSGLRQESRIGLIFEPGNVVFSWKGCVFLFG